MSIALIIFIKNPIQGKVKTRIGREIGDEAALQIYLQLCNLTRKIVDDFPGTKYLFYSDEIIENDEWNSSDFTKQKQYGKDLGERMANAFNYTFKKHERVIIIGSDCPYLQPFHLVDAIEKLSQVDCVIGPTKDGGYYLMGMKKLIPELFKDKKWSSESVLSDSLDDLKRLNFSFHLLETLEDIDNISDWERYQNAQIRRPKD